MKHSTFLKFICIVLCAASILTLAGSSLGLWCMVELDLYDKTVDQFLEDNYRDSASFFARNAAQRYASTELGLCPENLVKDLYFGVGFENRFSEDGMGYAIMDQEGNVLTEVNPELRASASQYFSFPVEGNYMHLVSAEPVPDVEVEIQRPGLGEGEYGIIDRVGEGASPVFSIQISYDGGSEGIGSDEPLGWLTRADDGTIYFEQAGDIGLSLFGDTEVTHITFMDDNDRILYEVADTKPVAAVLQNPSGGHSIHLLKEKEEPIAIQMGTPVYQAIFYGSEGEEPIEDLRGTQPIGSASLDDQGHLSFQLYVESSKLKEASGIYSLVLMDQDGTVLFGEANPQLRTTVAPVASSDGLHFSSHPNAVAVAMPTESAPAGAPEKDGAPEAAVQAEEPKPEDSAKPTEKADTIPVETMPEESVPVETTAPVVVETIPPAVQETIPEPTEPVLINGKPLETYDISSYTYYDNIQQKNMEAKVVYLTMPAYTVEVFLLADTDQNSHAYTLMELLRQYSALLLPLLLGSLVVLALTVVYLCVAAGHRRTGEIKAGGLNRIPLDLYLAVDTCILIGLGALTVIACTDLLPKNMTISLVLIPLMAYGMCLVFVGFCFALVSQCKTPGGYWWRNSLCGRLLTGGMGSLGKIGGWSVQKFFPWLVKLICRLWDLCLILLQKCWQLLVFLWNRISSIIRAVGRWLFDLARRCMAMLPLTWQWMVGGAVILLLGLLVWANRRDGWGILWLLVGFAAVLYLSQCFGILLGAAKRMNKGDLDTKINDKRMLGCFREFAVDLNNLADVVVVAAQKQLRSERMKTELITNVSHDIKTPLTSIINYVDLLQKPHTEEEGAEYLEVLDRQSQRLKKLIDDLMDMSKANTGNMHVEITRLDAVESVNQALGEFADKLEKAELTPVFRHNTPEAFIMADGKLVWRVLSNLLGNAIKYAMPGTRLYLDMMNLDGRVILSLKNISRDELNVDAEELMERFVRGDDSRNTEGSGLGLNIAKSLMELQKGHLQLLVDGDLFKVTLVFPTAE